MIECVKVGHTDPCTFNLTICFPLLRHIWKGYHVIFNIYYFALHKSVFLQLKCSELFYGHKSKYIYHNSYKQTIIVGHIDPLLTAKFVCPHFSDTF